MISTDAFMKEIALNGLALQIATQVKEIEDKFTASVNVSCNIYEGITIDVSSHNWDAEDDPAVPATMTMIRRHLGGKWSKDTAYHHFMLKRPLTDEWSLEISAPRKLVCEKRVVGTKTVTKRVPLGYEEKKVEEEIVEWDCPPSLLA